MQMMSILPMIALAMVGHAAADDDTYHMPPAVTGIMAAGAVMTQMETAVKPDVLAAFKTLHPAKFWLFGEDRQFAVRRTIIPAHWFEDGAKHYQRFAGLARPGEFYVFQVGLVAGDRPPPVRCEVVFDSLQGATSTVLSGSGKDGAGGRGLIRGYDGLLAIWIGLQIPRTAIPGNHAGSVRFSDVVPNMDPGNDLSRFAEELVFSIRVEGTPLLESGTDEAWRLARLKWLDSSVGRSDTDVTRPFTPVRFNQGSRSLDILGRRITLGPNGIPAQFASFFSGSNTKILATGKDAFAAPPRLECIVAGKVVEWKMESTTWHQSPVAVGWFVHNSGGDMTLDVSGELEYDGNLRLSMALCASNAPVQVDDVRMVVPWHKDVAKYAMGLGLQGGLCPDKLDWKWDVSKHQDAIWMGDVNIGAMLRFKDRSNYQRPLINAYYDFRPLNRPISWGSGGMRIEHNSKSAVLTAHCGSKSVEGRGKGERELHFDIDWYFTPFKPIDIKQHFTDRYYHSNQGAALEDTAALRKEGVNIVEVHHNRLCNPYINYPYNSDSFPHLQDFVKKAHGDGVRVNLYYTTRELTQNLPEFFALKSLAGEIILPRREGVAWPVTNGGGPHPWLKEHAGTDVVPAWRENLKFPEYKPKLDLAVITTPDSRWNNFYLEGLDYLVRKAGIDGLYIDDTALDRKSMQRARRILESDGNPGRRVTMHSWNHFNGLAKWSNSSIAFMELYPYYDGLWHGEGFDANASPEYMLVEMSGIPYGLMSEMLDHPNPWHGMVFGMRTRWPWSGDPRAIWKVEDRFGIADADYLGWWDPACPVSTDNPLAKVSVYRKEGRTLIALASWAPARTEVKLKIDWAALGLAAGKTTLWAPPCAGFQSEAVFTPEAAIPVDSNKGWLLIAGEVPRG